MNVWTKRLCHSRESDHCGERTMDHKRSAMKVLMTVSCCQSFLLPAEVMEG